MEPPVSSSRGPMSSLLGKLDSILECQQLLRNPVREDFELLKEDLAGIDTFLLEISDEDDPNLVKKYWMKEVREICYDAEDYIDWLIHSAEAKIGSVGVVPRLKISQLPSRKLTPRPRLNITRLPRTLIPRPRIANQIKELRARLEDAGERHKRYVLDNNTSYSYSSSSSVHSHSHSHWIPEWYREAVSILVDIDDSKKKLINLLNNGEKTLNVISVCGFGGIGKTTLVKQIFRELGGQFGCRAFVRVSRKPDTRSLLRSILSQTGCRDHSEACNILQLTDYLREHLQQRRYLIVMDDLWDTTVWEFLVHAFSDGTHSSRIITTTTTENIAMICCGNRSDYILKMEPLNDDESRKLFFERVFGSENKCPEQFKDASYEIVRKCGGVPLAVIHIAGLLAHQQDMSDWDYVERSLGSNLSISPTYEGMRKVINLSYNGLPKCLKTCLQYVSMYPEHCTIWKDDLVRRWIAEGFIEGDSEVIAQSHFEELVYRGMIDPIDIDYNEQVLSCTVHHMVLDFVTSKSAEDNFITTVDYSKNAGELRSKVRRLLLFYSSAKYAAKLSGMTLSQVRSLAFYGLVKCLPSIREFKFLRVLVLHLWGDQNDSTGLNLSGIDRLFKLKYLKVTCDFCVQLPTQMWGLNLLETLEINAKGTSVPEDIVHLKYLAHLSLPAATKLPYGMSRLRSLRTLKHFDLCGSSDEEVKSLKELSVLEELQLVLTTAPADSVERNLNVLFSILWVLVNLKSLALVRGASVPEDSVPIIDSSSMSFPTDCLERLELHRGTCILSRLPKWIGELGSLCILKLGILEILNHDVDSLAGLQVLKFLSLYVRRPTVEPIIFSSGTFPALECFKFRSGVLCITFHPGAMPKLRRLKLCFNAYSGVDYGNNMLAGIEHLLNLQEVSGRIGADVGAKESDKRMAEYAFKNALSRHLVIPRFNVQIVDWIEDDHVPAKNIILSKTMKVDHGIPGKESEDNTNKNADGWASFFADTGLTYSDLQSSEAQRMTGVSKGTELPLEIGLPSPDKYRYEKVGGSKVADPRPARVLDLSPAAAVVGDKARASTKNRRRHKKASSSPADAAASSISPMQRLFDTSREVFANSYPGFVPPPDAVTRLSDLLNELKPRDVRVAPSMSVFKHADPKSPPPVTYLHFYDSSEFSFGIFCLPKSAVFPLHNHPGMTVFSKILFGSMHLKSYDWAKSLPDSNDNALQNSDGARLARVNTDAVFDASSETVVLYPENGGNLHCFTALTPCAVLDVMGPPYNRDEGRDCAYYSESPYSGSCGGDEQFSWLKEVHSTFEMQGIKMEQNFVV